MFVDIKNPEERERFINDLFDNVKRIHFKTFNNKALNFEKKDIIGSIFPITLDVNTFEIDYLRNATSASASVTIKKISLNQ